MLSLHEKNKITLVDLLFDALIASACRTRRIKKKTCWWRFKQVIELNQVPHSTRQADFYHFMRLRWRAASVETL